MNNYITRSIKQKSKRRPTSMFLRLEDKKDLMKECGDAAMILFEYYLSKAGLENYEYTDQKCGLALGWSTRKVQETRLKLSRAGYFLQRKGKLQGGTVIFTYLGKDKVKNQLKIEHEEKIKG